MTLTDREGHFSYFKPFLNLSQLHTLLARIVLHTNLMAALPNIGCALCSTPQSLADDQY